jgi:hypothetical protein
MGSNYVKDWFDQPKNRLVAICTLLAIVLVFGSVITYGILTAKRDEEPTPAEEIEQIVHEREVEELSGNLELTNGDVFEAIGELAFAGQKFGLENEAVQVSMVPARVVVIQTVDGPIVDPMPAFGRAYALAKAVVGKRIETKDVEEVTWVVRQKESGLVEEAVTVTVGTSTAGYDMTSLTKGAKAYGIATHVYGNLGANIGYEQFAGEDITYADGTKVEVDTTPIPEPEPEPEPEVETEGQGEAAPDPVVQTPQPVQEAPAAAPQPQAQQQQAAPVQSEPVREPITENNATTNKNGATGLTLGQQNGNAAGAKEIPKKSTGGISGNIGNTTGTK